MRTPSNAKKTSANNAAPAWPEGRSTAGLSLLAGVAVNADADLSPTRQTISWCWALLKNAAPSEDVLGGMHRNPSSGKWTGRPSPELGAVRRPIQCTAAGA